ncbi:MAG: GNAT family N-acetyltransferase [Rubrivivax sp.]
MPASGWIPIRSLSTRHRPQILGHLLSLDDRDRYLRFGYLAGDAQIGRYVDQLDFERDEVFGIFNRRLELIALAHLACIATVDAPCSSAEFGVSVVKAYRGRGFGARLFDRAALHARNRHVDTLLIHALSENTAMMRIARSAGAHIERDGPESQAWLRLPPDNLGSQVEAMVEGQAANLDFGLKARAQFVSEFLHRRKRSDPTQDKVEPKAGD